MHAFVINLKRRPDRLADMERELGRVGLAFERVEAFDARNESLKGKVAWVKAYVYNFLKAPPIGHIGVYASHRRVWQIIVERNLPQALVFEDDIIPQNWDPAMHDINFAELGIDQLRLERTDSPGQEDINPLPQESYNGTKLLGRTITTENTWGAAAYIITRRGAEKCLAAGEGFWFFIDHYRMWTLFYDLKTAMLSPPMWTQVEAGSDIAPSARDELRESLLLKLAKVPRKALLGAMLIRKRLMSA